MDDDKTVIKSKLLPSIEQVQDPDQTVLCQSDGLNVGLGVDGKINSRFTFTDSFTVGRTADNTIVIDTSVVSRHHLEIKKENDTWWVYNLQSANGVFIDGVLIEQKQQLQFPVVISLGKSGIYLSIERIKQENVSLGKVLVVEPIRHKDSLQLINVDQSTQAQAKEEFKAKYLDGKEPENAGEKTRWIREEILKDRIHRAKSYKKVIWIFVGLFGLSVGLVAYQQFALANTRKLAIDMFYDIKSLEVNLAQANLRLEESANTLTKTLETLSSEKLKTVQAQLKIEQEKIVEEKQRMQRENERLANMKAKYRQYVQEANTFRLRFPSTERYEEELITKVARELGESELELPDEFMTEVKKYIHYWQASSRMQNAIDNFEKNNYLPIVIEALKKHGLPLYFIYLPLQESNYNNQAIGPETRFGIAKGAWQLLASTAEDYGITAGPLANIREYDAQDERFDFKRSTQAGTKYLNRIYSTEAQASGLLVMASYNYGDNRVRRMISNMPDNPRDKNFWKFIQQYELPKETHDYVFYIFAAAVIGENPQYFGFKFKPLLFSETTAEH